MGSTNVFGLTRRPLIFLTCLVVVGLALGVSAQSIQPIYYFTNGPSSPQAGLTLARDGNFYGTTSSGGISNAGTVFRVTAGGDVSMLASFSATIGQNPDASLTLGPDGNYYGTTYGGGSNDDGTVFRFNTNGTLTTLTSFAFTNGAYPHTALTLGPDGSFYGTSDYGGSNDAGLVFRITTNGTLTTLASFDPTNGEGVSGLTLGPDGNFYGTIFGYPTNDGAVFRMSLDGTLTVLHSFSAPVYNGTHNETNADGASPTAGLTLAPDGKLFVPLQLGVRAATGQYSKSRPMAL